MPRPPHVFRRDRMRISPLPGREVSDLNYDGRVCCAIEQTRHTHGWKGLFHQYHFRWSRPHLAWFLTELEGGGRLTVEAAIWMKRVIESTTNGLVTVTVRDEHPERPQAA